MTPEQEILSDLLEQARSTRNGLADSLSLIGRFPSDEMAFDGMSPVQRVASTAMLKQFEQLQDALARLFRTTLKILGLSLKGLYPLDIANRMEELDVLGDPATWAAIVKLRNELVHEYPLAANARFDRLVRAHAALPFLFDAADRLEQFIQRRSLLDEVP